MMGLDVLEEKEVPINFKNQWRCWQHPPPGEGTEVNRGGRPSKYDPSIIPKVEEWANEGLTDYEISKRLGISTVTLYDWKKKYPEFSKSLKRARLKLTLEWKILCLEGPTATPMMR